MTENEAIEWLKNIYIGINQSDKCISLKMAISALIDIQKYRSIGPVEECREIMQRQKPKKRIDGKVRKCIGHYQCPTCGGLLTTNKMYCETCGQAIDWSDTE